MGLVEGVLEWTGGVYHGVGRLEHVLAFATLLVGDV